MSVYIKFFLFLVFHYLGAHVVLAQKSWVQSYSAGYLDQQGQFAGGSEIMHIVSHKSKLYAANGYWMDARWVIPPAGQKQSSQVLRLDSAKSQWQVDLDTGKSNKFGLEYMKGNVLKSVTFTKDEKGKQFDSPINLLVMASGSNFERGGAVSVWVRDDSSGVWHHSLVRHGSSNGGVRWVPRDMEVYMDKVTGKEKLFMSLGNPGIVAGSYDEKVPGKIRWEKHVEYPFLNVGSLRTRPLGLARANGSLFFSEGGAIFKRIDGEVPTYSKILDFHEDSDTDVGGIRGLTSIKNPKGSGQSLLFLWAPGDRSECQVKRMDLNASGEYEIHDEVKLIDLMSDTIGAEVTYTLGAHNMMYPVIDEKSGKTVHLIGFQGNIRTKKKLRWKGSALYAGALYAVRQEDQTYKVLEVNNSYEVGRRPLVAPRAFCVSPFNDDSIYIGGHDSSRKVSDNMAWIFNATTDIALGKTKGESSISLGAKVKPDKRLLSGPVYELRIYSATEGRFGNLNERFREHTDRLFKKHGLQVVGYWTPTEGPSKKRRRFIYVLKHNSRYDAYLNWVSFSNDKEWERVLDQPKFQGLLALKPESLFMKASEFSGMIDDDKITPGGIYELRTYVTYPGKLKSTEEKYTKNIVNLLQSNGIKDLFGWRAFDLPESKNTFIRLLHHPSEKEAVLNWKSFINDNEQRNVLLDSKDKKPLLAFPPETIMLKSTDFSPLK